MESSVDPKPAEEEIRLRAYYLYLQRERDGQEGTATDDWLRAEAEQIEHRPGGTPPTGVLRRDR